MALESALHAAEAEVSSHGVVAIYHPKPIIPDDLLREVHSTTVVARFYIEADGSMRVELLIPSRNPRLNRLVLETLKTWRFKPAMKDGHPIASTVDSRGGFAE